MTSLKTYFPWVFPWILAGIFAFLLWFIWNKYDDVKADNGSLISLNAMKSDTIRYFTAKDHVQEAEINVTQTNESTLKAYLAQDKGAIDSLSKKLKDANIQIKNLISANITKATIGIQGNQAPITAKAHDTTTPAGIKELTFHTETKWYNIGGTVDSMHNVSLSPLNFPITLSAIAGYKRSWILGKRHLVVDESIDNPYGKITSIQDVVVTPDKNWLSKTSTHYILGGIAGAILYKELQIFLSKH